MTAAKNTRTSVFIVFSCLVHVYAQTQDVNTTPSEVYGMPKHIDARDTSAGWKQSGQKLLITGMVYKSDGKTPAPNVVLYYYHTNTGGRYLHKADEKRSLPPNSKGQTHGYIRGWVKTGKDGKYAIYTVRPGTYPTRDEPAHIHPVIIEPGMSKGYYIDDFVFDDDAMVNTARRRKMENRGGSGILRVLVKGDLQIAEHNIILGLNIPNYPNTGKIKTQSGLQVGEDQPSFTPFHAFGPDKGTKTCPVCKYGRYHGIVYFVGNRPDWTEIKQWLVFLEQQSIMRDRYLKAYFVYGNDQHYSKDARQQELERIGVALGLKRVALTFVPSFADSGSDAYLNKINPSVENTFIIYRHASIVDKYVDLKPTAENYKLLADVLDKTKGDYFDLATP